MNNGLISDAPTELSASLLCFFGHEMQDNRLLLAPYGSIYNTGQSHPCSVVCRSLLTPPIFPAKRGAVMMLLGNRWCNSHWVTSCCMFWENMKIWWADDSPPEIRNNYALFLNRTWSLYFWDWFVLFLGRSSAECLESRSKREADWSTQSKYFLIVQETCPTYVPLWASSNPTQTLQN